MKTPKTAGLFAALLATLLTNALHAGSHGIEIGSSEIVSRPAPGMVAETPGTDSYISSVSSDGRYVALVSTASNLVPGESNPLGNFNVYLFDRTTARMTLVSHADGHPASSGDFGSAGGALSADGRFLAFESTATDLVPGQNEPEPRGNIFLYDRVAGTTTLVSHTFSSPTTPCDCFSTLETITPDGRFVAYQSFAADLVAGQAGPLQNNIYLWDRTTGATSLVSHAAGAPAVGGDLSSEGFASSSADGRFVLFRSYATDLVAGQGGPAFVGNLFLSDRVTDTITLISHIAGSATTSADQQSYGIMSADGRFVVFSNDASNLVPGQIDPSITKDYFLWDRIDGSTVLLSHAAGEPVRAVGGAAAAISDDGSTIAIAGDASKLLPGPGGPGGQDSVILIDRASGNASRITPESSTPGSFGLTLSADGRFVLIGSDRTDLVSGQVDSPGTTDLFLFDRGAAALTLVSHTSGAPTVAAQNVSNAFLSADGTVTIFSSNAANLVAGLNDTNGVNDIFAYRRTSQEVTAVTRRALGLPSSTAGGGNSALSSADAAVSADGRWVAFVSSAANLVSHQVNPVLFNNVFLRDRTTGITRLVSHASGNSLRPANQASTAPVISRDGRWVAFESLAGDLVAGQQDPELSPDVFLYDRESGTVTLVSHSTAGPAVANSGMAPSLNDDGDIVAFLSRGTGLIPGQIDVNDDYDVFLYRRGAGAITLASHVPGSLTTTGDSGSRSVALSATGRFAIFTSTADNLTASDANETEDVFVYDQITGRTALVSHAAGSPGTAGNGASFEPVISADGRFIAFTSEATDLIHAPDSSDTELDIFLVDRLTDRTTLVSHQAGSPATPGGAYPGHAVISRDGGFVAYNSAFPNLVPGQTTAGQDIFLWNRNRDRTVLASHSAASSTAGGDNPSVSPRLSADGRWVAFASAANDLVPDMFNPYAATHGFLFDSKSGKVSLVDHLPGSATASIYGLDPNDPVLVPAGRCVVYASPSPDLVALDFNGRQDVFIACRGGEGGDD